MSGWKTARLGDVCEIERGGSPRPISDFVTNADDGVNWIKITDATASGKCIYTTEEKIIPEGVKRSRMVYPGDFILSNSMSFGRPYIMQTSGCIHDGWLVLRKPNADTDFLYYILSSEVVSNQFESLAAGSTVRNLNVQIAKEVKIPLPPLAEQRKIAEILRTWDEAIETAEAELKAKQERKRWLMQKLLNPSAGGTLSERLASWRKVKLETVGSFQNGEAFSSDYFNYEKQGLRLVRNRDLKNDDQVVYYGGEYAEHDVVRNGDLLVGMDGDFTPVIWTKGKALLNQRVGRVHVKDGVSPGYIYYALFSALAELEHVTSATTVKHLSSKTCLGLEIRLPLVADQRKIAEVLQSEDEGIDSLKAKADLLRNQKRGLMQKLLTGEVRVAA